MAKAHTKAAHIATDSQPEPRYRTIGCTTGEDTTVGEIATLRAAGISTIQTMVDFDRYGNCAPPGPIRQRYQGMEILLHMPFYFHLMLQRSPVRSKYFKSLQRHWAGTKVIVHCKGIHQAPGRTRSVMLHCLQYYASLCPDVMLCLENDAGGKLNPAPSIKCLARVVGMLKNKNQNVGLCIDTQHAYAAGDDITSIDFKTQVDIVHLNAIPKHVQYGGHLDRHSTTPLSSSKNGTGFIHKILSAIGPEVPVILERMDNQIILSDIRILKRMSYVPSTMEMVEKDMG